MSKRRVTDTQRIIAYGMGANADQLTVVIETLQAIRDSRFPRVAAPAKRTVARKPRQSRLNPLPKVDSGDVEGDSNG